MLDDCSVLFDRVDKLYCKVVEPAEASEGKNVQLRQDLDDEFCREPIELINSQWRWVCNRGGHYRADSVFRAAHRPGCCRRFSASCIHIARNRVNFLFSLQSGFEIKLIVARDTYIFGYCNSVRQIYSIQKKWRRILPYSHLFLYNQLG